jgi:hypothetical protein
MGSKQWNKTAQQLAQLL